MSNRYQREIEEILKKSGELSETIPEPKPKLGFWRLVWLNVKKSLGGKPLSVSPGRVMLTAVSLLLVALFIRSIGGGIAGAIALVGLLLFIIGYGMFFVQPRSKRPDGEIKKWRGQPIEYESDESSLWDRLRRRFGSDRKP